MREVTADSGYCSEKNLLYLKEQNISSYIKLQDHEKRKTRAYLEDIGTVSYTHLLVYTYVSYLSITFLRFFLIFKKLVFLPEN